MIENGFSMQRDILNAQLKAESEILDSKTEATLLSDRCAIDPVVYLAHYSGAEDVRKITSTNDWQKVCRRYADIKRSLIILLLPVMEFLVDDNIRYVAKSVQEWHALATTFQTLMKEEGIPFVEIGEECLEIQDRVAVVLEHSGVDQNEAVPD
jgi:hypothetical protein